MKQVFRTTAKYWAMQEGAGVFISLVGASFFLWCRIYWLVIISLAMGVSQLKDVFRLCENFIVIDEKEITSTNKKESVCVAWRDVIAAQFARGARASKYLLLWTSEQEYSIPIHQFDYQCVMQLVESYLSPAALEENAVHAYPPYKQAIAAKMEQLATLNRELKVRDHWLIKTIGWGLLLFCVPAIGLFLTLEVLLSLLPIAFAILGALIVMNTGSLTLDRERLMRKTLLGRYQMRWDEVKWIEHHEQETAWLLCGENKQMAILPPTWCLGEDRELYASLLQAEIFERGIPLKRTPKVLWKWSKNTKIK